ncbi:MAG: TRAP transporter small permease [Xanthomonadales bacterium]|jgi:TRAP-type C4-dicarboxylate transport system permease small subunit|nr:TRAP transporter small permease [Xanthomonadales bacterium]
MNDLLRRLEATGRWTEDLLLSGILLALIGIATWQIVGRNLLGTSLVTGDELLRIMVLWLTLAGAVAASRADKHIAISLLDRYLAGWQLNGVRFLSHAFTAAVCGFIAWHAWAFVQTSREFEDTLLGGTPAWWLQLPLPAGFAVMTYRHALHALGFLFGRPPATPGRPKGPESPEAGDS